MRVTQWFFGSVITYRRLANHEIDRLPVFVSFISIILFESERSV